VTSRLIPARPTSIPTALIGLRRWRLEGFSILETHRHVSGGSVLQDWVRARHWGFRTALLAQNLMVMVFHKLAGSLEAGLAGEVIHVRFDLTPEKLPRMISQRDDSS